MYRGRYFIIERVYVCGDYLDADVFPVFQPPGKRRSKCKPSSEVQRSLNLRNARKKMTRTAHLNFTPGDIALHLTYSENPGSPEQAQRDLRNFLRRVKRLRGKLGLPPLKYMSVTELSGTGRAHHHVIMSGGAGRDEVERLWGKGYANSVRLQFEKDGVAGLVNYVTKGRQFYKRWNQSRNLLAPAPSERVVTRGELRGMADAIEGKRQREHFERRYPGWELTEAGCEKNAVNGHDYVCFDMRRRRE